MKIFLETYGCEMNKVTTEIMASRLIAAGHSFVGRNDAELIIINSCSLEPLVERKILKRLTELRNSGIKILVTGCMADVKRELILQKIPGASVAGLSSVSHIDEIIDKMRQGNQVIRLSDTPKPLVGQERTRINQAVAVIQIAEGCLDNCTFCIDRSIIGALKSYDPDKILREIKSALSSGCIEIHLSSQDVATFGRDISVNLPALLRKIGVVAGTYRVKLGPMNPASVLPILDDLILSFNRPNIYQYLDMPVQSGSNKILDSMKRKYTAEDYARIVSAFRKRFPSISISTDVMVGFPGEGDDEYRQTVGLIRETKPDILNIYAYGDMPLTKAGPTNVPSWKIKERFVAMQQIAEEMKEASLKKWLNWGGEVYVSEKAAEGYVARNYAYLPVLVNGATLGDIKNVEISGVSGGYLTAR